MNDATPRDINNDALPDGGPGANHLTGYVFGWVDPRGLSLAELIADHNKYCFSESRRAVESGVW